MRTLEAARRVSQKEQLNTGKRTRILLEKFCNPETWEWERDCRSVGVQPVFANSLKLP